MKYKCPLIVVEDMERSRKFYEEILGQKVILDFGANITFGGDFSLQTKESWSNFIDRKENTIAFRSNNFELYFEEREFDEFIVKLKAFGVELVHDVKEFPWGQKAIRFYDPDHHIIEVGENMVSVVKRFAEQEMSNQEIHERTELPLEFIRNALEAKPRKRLVSVKC